MIVDKLEFVNEMERLWTQKLDNKCSEGFRTIWTRMAEAYAEAIAENMKWHPLRIVLDPPRWLVIAPEMGSGKTYGACLYLAMMARVAKTVPAPFQLGGLFVCHTIKQCEEAVELINGHAG